MKNSIFKYIFLFFKGILVGFGAIMPGISGGTLCVSFGMYTPLINVMSHPIKTLRKDGVKLLFFVLGGAVGFFGLAELAKWLLSVNESIVILVFIGFILGTLPDLWNTAGENGRNKFSYLFIVGGFVVLFSLLYLLKNVAAISMDAGFFAFFFCGVLWALSFIVPGLSSSTLIMFFGLYDKMLDGISSFVHSFINIFDITTPFQPIDFSVILPIALGVLVCLAVVSHPINFLINKWHSQVSHTIIGVVLASMVMVVPFGYFTSAINVIVAIVSIVGGAAVSYLAGRLTNNLK